MRQHFELGQFLRNRYKGFLNESYDRHEVGVLTSASDHVTHRPSLWRATVIPANVRDEGPLPMLVLLRVQAGAGIPGTGWRPLCLSHVVCFKVVSTLASSFFHRSRSAVQIPTAP